MEPIKPANTYAAYPSGTATYRHGPHVFKVYYVDITGREQPERYEWALCGRSRDSVLNLLAQASVEGIGAVVSFPHITKVFRFAPGAETIMHVRAFKTEDFAEINLAREEGYLEFACYAEAIIAADEYRFWAEAQTVEEYLRRWSDCRDAVIADHTKLQVYFDRNE
jgi:hypothetical protein